MSILAAIVFFQAKRNTQKITGESIYSEGSLVKTLSTIGILIVYGLMLERLGFIVTTFLVFLFIFKKVSGTSWFIGILESLIVTGYSYFIFGYLLKTTMPRGWLGF
jgi:putative tricarboxylic transport membrane protein